MHTLCYFLLAGMASTVSFLARDDTWICSGGKGWVGWFKRPSCATHPKTMAAPWIKCRDEWHDAATEYYKLFHATKSLLITLLFCFWTKQMVDSAVMATFSTCALLKILFIYSLQCHSLWTRDVDPTLTTVTCNIATISDRRKRGTQRGGGAPRKLIVIQPQIVQIDKSGQGIRRVRSYPAARL